MNSNKRQDRHQHMFTKSAIMMFYLNLEKYFGKIYRDNRGRNPLQSEVFQNQTDVTVCTVNIFPK